MSQDITLLQLHNLRMVQMQVTSIDRGAGYFADYISGFSDGRYGDFLDADALVAVPAECQHSLIGTVVGFVQEFVQAR